MTHHSCPNEISLRFFAALNDFLAPTQRENTIHQALTRRASIKDVIESFNVPHTEVETIVLNERSVDFSCLVENGDQIEVYPLFCTPDVIPLVKLRPVIPQPPRFVVDCNLGRLSRHLRLLGFDTLYSNSYQDNDIAALSNEENRVLLTRDRFLLQHKIITWGYFVRSVQPAEQLREVIKRFELKRLLEPFSRCIRCNGGLEQVDKQSILDQLEPKTVLYYDDFRRCSNCGQIYWRGSHYQNAMRFLDSVLQSCSTPVHSACTLSQSR